MAQLMLVQLVEEIGLVLVVVFGALQPAAASSTVDAGVVTGRDPLGAECQCVVEKRLELDLAIAQYIGIGRAAGAILSQKVLEHAIPVLGSEVDCVQRYS